MPQMEWFPFSGGGEWLSLYREGGGGGVGFPVCVGGVPIGGGGGDPVVLSVPD